MSSTPKRTTPAEIESSAKSSRTLAGRRAAVKVTARGDTPVEGNQAGTSSSATGTNQASTPITVGNNFIIDPLNSPVSRRDLRKVATPLRRTRSSSPMVVSPATMIRMNYIHPVDSVGSGDTIRRLPSQIGTNLGDSMSRQPLLHPNEATNQSQLVLPDPIPGTSGEPQKPTSNEQDKTVINSSVASLGSSLENTNTQNQQDDFGGYLIDFEQNLMNEELAGGCAEGAGDEWQTVKGKGTGKGKSNRKGRGGKGKRTEGGNATGNPGVAQRVPTQGGGPAGQQRAPGATSVASHPRATAGPSQYKNEKGKRFNARKRKQIRRENGMTYAKAVRTSPEFQVIIRCVWPEGMPEDHEFDDDDWDAIEQAIFELFESEDSATCGFHPGKDVLGKGKRDGAMWINCRNQAMLSYIKRATEYAQRPEGREDMSYRYRAFGPGESPYRYLMLRGIKKFLWRERSVFLANLIFYNDWLDGEHIAITGGLLDRDQDLPGGERTFNITLQVSETALDRIIDHECELQISSLSSASVRGRQLKERIAQRNGHGAPQPAAEDQQQEVEMDQGPAEEDDGKET